jgi:hypothetical protein
MARQLLASPPTLSNHPSNYIPNPIALPIPIPFLLFSLSLFSHFPSTFMFFNCFFLLFTHLFTVCLVSFASLPSVSHTAIAFSFITEQLVVSCSLSLSLFCLLCLLLALTLPLAMHLLVY